MTPSESRAERPEEVTATVAVTAREEVPVPSGLVDIGLADNQIMQRYLVRRIFREAEFEIKEGDGDVTTGFITGFDEYCIQISTAPLHELDEPQAKLVFWPIRSIKETGRKIDDLPFEHKTKIRSYSNALRAQCEKTLAPNDHPPQRVRPKTPPVVKRSDPTTVSFSDKV